MRLMVTFLRAYPSQSAITLAALLSVGLIEGFGLSLLVPLLGIAVGGSLNTADTVLFRVSAQVHESNGFRDNTYLGRDNTNGRDETGVRLGLSFDPMDTLKGKLSVVYSKIDNGYDAFAIDNAYTVLSDKPGKDGQESVGASLRLDWSDVGPGELPAGGDHEGAQGPAVV